jgi:hypothetical protein
MADHRYGYAHKQVRKRFAPLVRAGKVRCWRCSELIPGGNAPWDLGHVDDPVARREFGPRWPEHRRCNRRTAALWKERATSTRSTPPEPIIRYSRQW